MRKRTTVHIATALAAGLASLVLPGAASALERPAVTTGAASNVGQSTVQLNGSVNPRGGETTYFFQYGTTVIYGATTPAASAGAGRERVRVSAAVTGLAPATRYHFRLVAQNERGLTRGRDRTFRTARQPLGVTLTAAPNPVRPNHPTLLSGTLTGTGNANRQVVLQANPFPYTQGFLPAANVLVTDASGNFSFPVLSVPVTTQYRVQMPQRPEVASPVVVVGAKVRVTTHKRVSRRGRGRSARVRLWGRVLPAVDGAGIQIQKSRGGGPWRTIRTTAARAGGTGFSRYSVRLRQRRSGSYRVYAAAQGAYVPNAGRVVRVRVRR